MTASLDEEAIVAALEREYQVAADYRDDLDEIREQANFYYDAKPFGNETDGRSQVVLPDVQEVIDYMTASVIRTFNSGDRIVEFEASEEEHEQAAEEATATINYVFTRKQDGRRILLDVCTDGLLNKIGVFKSVVEEDEYVHRERVVADPVQLELLAAVQGFEVEDLAENEDGTVTASIRQQKTRKCFRDYAVAPSRFLFSPMARHEDSADYLAHIEPKTRSDLVEMGFEPEQVYDLPIASLSDETERLFDDGRYLRDQEADSTPALEKVLLHEEYARIDVDGDGIAERIRVFRVEKTILRYAGGESSLEVVEDQPFSVFCPFPRAHLLAGYSLAEKVMDIQLLRSTIARQLLDGMAFANLPRPVVDTNLCTTETLDDILSPIPGSPIRAKGGVAAVQPFHNSFDVGKSLSVMEWITGERESRTGITRLNQGLDADALNKTATGTALMQAQGQQQEEFIAHNLAEAVARMFMKKYRLMRTEGEVFRIKVDGEYKTIDPSHWPEDMHIIVRTGLGSGNKDKRVAARMALAQPLQLAMEAGMAGPEHVFRWFDGVARDTGIGQGDDFVYDPAQSRVGPDGQPVERKDPATIEAEAAAQQTAMELDAKREEKAAEIGLKQQESAAKIQIMRDEKAAKIDLERQEAEEEAILARERMQFEAELARQKASDDAALRQHRPGGDLDK